MCERRSGVPSLNERGRAITISGREPEGEYLTLSAQIVGQGEPIILIHGLAGSSRWWRRNIPVLAQHYQLYLIDLPGFGTLHHLRWQTALDDVASGIVHWMERSSLARAHLIGHSMGGYLSLWIAAQHPERIRRLVLVSPAGIPHIRSLPGYAFPLLKALSALQPRFLSLLLSDALRAGPLTILRAARDLLTKDIRDCLPDISAPTLLIWGENDSLVPPVLGELLSQQLPQARLLLIKKAGHVSMFEQPDQFNTAVLSFLAESIDRD